MSQKIDILRCLKHLILSLVGAGLLQACSPPPCPYSKPTFIIKETSKLTEDSIVLAVDTQLESLKKLKTSRPQTEIELNIGRLTGLREKVNERSYYGNHKMETITLVTDLMCTYWDLRFNRSLRKEERELWGEKFFQLDQQLNHVIFPNKDTITDKSSVEVKIDTTPEIKEQKKDTKTITLSPPSKICTTMIEQVEVLRNNAQLLVSGIACSQDFKDDKLSLWLFVRKGDNYFAKESSHVSTHGETWSVSLQLKDFQKSTGVLLMKFPQNSIPQSNGFGNSGRNLTELRDLGGIILGQQQIPPST